MTLPRQGGKAVRRSRDRLFKEDPHCHWCGVLTLQPGKCPAFHPDMATLDHLKPRRECVSIEQYHSEKNHVLSCRECNQQRDQVDCALMEHQKKQQAFIEQMKASKRPVLVKSRYIG